MSTAPHNTVRGRWLSSSRSTHGIAAIEFAGVIALSFVMIALGTSAYRTYSARAEVSDSLIAVAPIQTLIGHTFERTGIPPASARDVIGLADAITAPPPGQGIAIDHGRIEISFGSAAAPPLRGKTLYVTPFEATDGRVIWRCGDPTADIGLYPLGFVAGTNRTAERPTTIERRYLPEACR